MVTRQNVSVNQSNSFLKVKQPQVKPHREDSDMISVIYEAQKKKKQATGGKLAYIMDDSACHTC